MKKVYKTGKDHPNWKGGKPQPFNMGDKNPSWKGGVTSINHLLRDSIEYNEWRVGVFERDLYTCQFCGETGGYLQADHIKRFADYPDLRFDLSNGQTLCYECHRKKTIKENKTYWKNQFDKGGGQ